MKDFRCGIIGCGRIGCGFDDDKSQKVKRTHAAGYIQNPRTKLVSLSDIDSLKLRKYGKKLSVKNTYTDPKQMFVNESLDIVSICTLGGSHYELIKEAVKNGVKGIFIEKPISDNLRDTQKIIKLCKKNNIVLAVDHQRRYEELYQKIKNILKNGELGKINFVNVYYGAGIANTGTHVFDLLRMFFGDISSVSAKKSKFKSPNPLDPNLDVILEFKKGHPGSVQALDFSNFATCEFDIFGTKGRLCLDLISNNANLLKMNSMSHDYKKLSLVKKMIDKSKKSGTVNGLNNLVECIISKKTPLCSGMDGYKSLELVVASNLSTSKNKTIRLPLKTNSYKINSK